MRTLVRIKGIKRYRHPVTGLWYAYHRATGTRIVADFGSPEFFVELAALAQPAKKPSPVPGSIGLVIDEFMRSPHWGALRPKTRISYERAFAVLMPIRSMPIVQFDRAFIFRLRDEKLFPKHGRWLANYAVTTLSVLFAFAHDRGWLRVNPLTEKVRKLRASSDDRGANRPWSELECSTVMDRAPAHLKLPLALAMCAGLRKADFLSVTMASINVGMITVRTSKRGVPVAIPVHPILAAAIAARPKSDALQIAVTSRGKPWTESGFNASFNTFKKRLEAEGVINPGLTPHGLRHTLGTRLREAGADDRTIADVLGQRSTSMARHYSENAALPDTAKDLVSGLNLTGANRK